MAKLKTALVLLIIGSFSGLAIVGVQTLTEDRIEENRIQAQYEDYAKMFPELADVEEEDIEDDDVLDKKFTILDSGDEEIGTIYRGHDSNSQGDVTVLVGISGNTLVDVVISSTDNTPSYVRPLEDNHISKLSDTEFDDISYDSNTGATVTYESVQKVIDAAIDRSGGEISDPELELYQEHFDDADSYQVLQKFEDLAFDNEKAVYDADSEFLGFSYRIPLEDGDVYMLLDAEDAFVGFFTFEEDAESEYGDVLEAFESYEGDNLEDIDHDAEDETETTLVDAVDEAADLLDGTTRVNHEYLSRYEPYTVDGDEEGTLYTGMAEGYKSENVIQVAIDEDGQIIHIEIILTDDTMEASGEGDYSFDGIQEKVIDELDTLYGKTEVTESETDDAFSGASTTGDSIYDVIAAALDYESERTSD
ncbi:MAG: FMN-binding protein [Candidatus Izemoplasmataceae bacterium]